LDPSGEGKEGFKKNLSDKEKGHGLRDKKDLLEGIVVWKGSQRRVRVREPNKVIGVFYLGGGKSLVVGWLGGP